MLGQRTFSQYSKTAFFIDNAKNQQHKQNYWTFTGEKNTIDIKTMASLC